MNITDLNNKLNSINKVVDYKKLKNTLADAADLSKTLTSHDFASILPRTAAVTWLDSIFQKDLQTIDASAAQLKPIDPHFLIKC